MAESQCEIENRKLKQHHIDDIEYNKECQRKEKLKKNEELVEFLDKCPDLTCPDLKKIQDEDCKQYCKKTHGTNEGACFHQNNSKSDFCLCGSDELARNKKLREYMEHNYVNTMIQKCEGYSNEAREINCFDKCVNDESTYTSSCGINSLYWGLINELEVYRDDMLPICFCMKPGDDSHGKSQCLEFELNHLYLIMKHFSVESCSWVGGDKHCTNFCKQRYYPSSRVYGECVDDKQCGCSKAA